jgi:mRNA-degrading endonuclease RelE of RelBE toxin-antitoxin system
MRHSATSDFWKEYRSLPERIRSRADEKFSLLKANPQHPSLQFKKLGERLSQEIWSARVTLNYRALAIKRADGYLWFWIGDHNTYDSLVS